jgi:RHS repeat-associated protein
VNRVTSPGDSAHHPYQSGDHRILGYFNQPVGTGLAVDARPRFAIFSAAATTTAYLADINEGPIGPSHTAGETAGQAAAWTAVPASGVFRLAFKPGDSNSGGLDGIVSEGYEYRRYQSGATAAWLPLRFPGQYFDAETDLFQNWNRFYDANVGRYLEADPLWLYPEQLVPLAGQGRSAPVYAYASNNPVSLTDPSGRIIAVQPGEGAEDLNAFVNEAFNDSNNPAHEAVIAASMSSRAVTLEGGADLSNKGRLAETGPARTGDGILVQVDKKTTVDRKLGENRNTPKFTQRDQFGKVLPGTDSYDGIIGHEFGHVYARLTGYGGTPASNYMALEINNGFRRRLGQPDIDMSYGHSRSGPRPLGPVEGPASISPYFTVPWLR